jgi:hypothetical protein
MCAFPNGFRLFGLIDASRNLRPSNGRTAVKRIRFSASQHWVPIACVHCHCYIPLSDMHFFSLKFIILRSPDYSKSFEHSIICSRIPQNSCLLWAPLFLWPIHCCESLMAYVSSLSTGCSNLRFQNKRLFTIGPYFGRSTLISSADWPPQPKQSSIQLRLVSNLSRCWRVFD